jgi:hypothetical protein
MDCHDNNDHKFHWPYFFSQRWIFTKTIEGFILLVFDMTFPNFQSFMFLEFTLGINV